MMYLGIHDLPIYNFDKILKGSDLRYLLVKWNEREEVEIPKEAPERWNTIYNLYCEATENNEALTYYSLITKLSYFESKYIIVHTLIISLSENNKVEFGERLNKLDIIFDANKTVDSQFKDLERQLRIAEQDIKITKSKVDALKSNTDEEPSSLIATCIRIEKKTGVKINTRKDSVEYYLESIKLFLEIVEQENKARNG